MLAQKCSCYKLGQFQFHPFDSFWVEKFFRVVRIMGLVGIKLNLTIQLSWLTLFKMGGKKALIPTSFLPVTSANMEISPEKLSFNPLSHWCKIWRPYYLVSVLNYWTWTNSTPQKIGFSGQLLIKLKLWPHLQYNFIHVK